MTDGPRHCAVVNLRAKPTAYYVYVGRKFAGHESHPLANPFKITEDTPDNRAAVLKRYRRWLDEHPHRDDLLRDLWADTEAGRMALACWCVDWSGLGIPPMVCHAVVLSTALFAKFGPV